MYRLKSDDLIDLTNLNRVTLQSYRYRCYQHISLAPVDSMGLKNLWICYGKGKNIRYLPIHSIASCLGSSKSLALPMFHAMAGCDTVLYFAIIG